MFNFGLSILLLMPNFGTTIQSTICHGGPTSPVFTTLSATTTNPTYIISGVTSPTTSLNITDNTQQIATLKSDSSGNFTLQVSLVEGSNTFGAVASNSCGTSTNNTQLVLTRTSQVTPPPSNVPATTQVSPAATGHARLVQTPPVTGNTTSNVTANTVNPRAVSPAGGSLFLHLQVLPLTHRTTKATVFIKGSTLPLAQVTLADNDQQSAQVTAAPDGSFGVSVPLILGNNQIMVRATLNDQTSSQTLSVTRTLLPVSRPWYKQPLPLGLVIGSPLIISIVGIGIRRQARRVP